jgi:gas vesicle protein
METAKNTGKQIIGLLTGAVLGTILGLLFAPHKGSKTRSRISTRAKYIARTVKGKITKEADLIEEEAEKIDATVDKLTNSKKKK